MAIGANLYTLVVKIKINKVLQTLLVIYIELAITLLL